MREYCTCNPKFQSWHPHRGQLDNQESYVVLTRRMNVALQKIMKGEKKIIYLHSDANPF